MTDQSASSASGEVVSPEQESAAARLEAVEVVLFDLDGTLIDTLDLIRESMRYTTEAVLGEALPDDVLMHNVGVPLIVQMREFDEARADEMLRVYREHNWRVHDALVKEYPGVEPALQALMGRGLRLGVVTSKARPVAERGLERFDLGPFFDLVVSYDDVPVHKPDPFPLTFAAEQLRVAADRCAYVGDSPHDMAAASAAGCVAIAATWGVSSRERLVAAGAEYEVASMEDVVLLFEGGGSAYLTGKTV